MNNPFRKGRFQAGNLGVIPYIMTVEVKDIPLYGIRPWAQDHFQMYKQSIVIRVDDRSNHYIVSSKTGHTKNKFNS